MSVCLVDGTWRILDGERALALHGRDPNRDADRVAAELLQDTPPDLLVVVGLGLGYLLDALERRAWTGKVLAFEPEPGTVEAMFNRRSWHAWLAAERLVVLTAPDFFGAADCWRWLAKAKAAKVHVDPVLARLRPREVARAQEVLARIRFDAIGNTEARDRIGGVYLLNTLRNLAAIARESDASALTNAAVGVPAVIAAAGPSLDAALPALREAQGSALIIAVDTVVRPLLRAGITPDLVVAVDPTEVNGRHLTDLPPCQHTFLVTEGSVEPAGVEAFAGRTFFFRVADHDPWPWLRAAGRDTGTLRAWGSVLTTAFDLAVQMGCNPVAYVGADLSYPGAQPYCRGLAFELDAQRRADWGVPLEQQWRESIQNKRKVMEPDVNGQPVRTAPQMVAFRNWLADQMRVDPSRRFINATGAGILHGPGIEQMSVAGLVAVLHHGTGRCGFRLKAEVIAGRYRSLSPNAVLAAASAIVARGPESIPEAWKTFAPDVDRGAMVDAIESALRANQSWGPPSGGPSSRGEVVSDLSALRQIAEHVRLVPMELPPHRLEMTPAGTRVFRYRTTAARIMSAALRPPDGAVTEDGCPLRRAADVDRLAPGSYAIDRDEVHLRPADGSDPRWNGRAYALLVPSAIAYLEHLPLDEIVDRRI